MWAADISTAMESKNKVVLKIHWLAQESSTVLGECWHQEGKNKSTCPVHWEVNDLLKVLVLIEGNLSGQKKSICRNIILKNERHMAINNNKMS